MSAGGALMMSKNNELARVTVPSYTWELSSCGGGGCKNHKSGAIPAENYYECAGCGRNGRMRTFVAALKQHPTAGVLKKFISGGGGRVYQKAAA